MADYKPKLIEVALPLAAINKEAARERYIHHGHPSRLHIWWAPRPLAATRAVIWASLVDDPSGDSTLTREQQKSRRRELYEVLEQLVRWENCNKPEVLAAARREIDRCYPAGPPAIVDPFGGGGAIALEAQRLGLRALTGDLNPVAVLIQKAKIDIPCRFADRRPVHPDADVALTTWRGAQGLAADVDAYGMWMRQEAERRIGRVYPAARGRDGEELVPVAWLWARTVESPDPAWSGHVPLVKSWLLVNKPAKRKVWIDPIIDRETQTISYRIRTGDEPTQEGTAKGGNGTCIATGAAIPSVYIKSEACAGRMGQQLMAIVAEAQRGRTYCTPSEADESAAASAEPAWRPQEALPSKGLGFRVQPYGLDEWSKLFTPRQLTALTTFSDLLLDVRENVLKDAHAAGLDRDGTRLRDGGAGAEAYADAVVTYLAFVVDKCADYWSTICTWQSTGEKMGHTFGRQAIPMSWDFGETNPFSSSAGNWAAMVRFVCKALDHLPASVPGRAVQRDARARVRECVGAAVSTDPPYYDNIGYADLSDFFYVWLRRNLAEIWPDECATLLSPKSDELIADPDRHSGRSGADAHFESGMAEFMAEVAQSQPADVPATIYYAYKATETADGEVRTTGWATFLQSVINAGLQVIRTWPIRTELVNRLRGLGSNALASSIVLVCRPRSVSAPLATRGEFIAALRDELPEAVEELQSGNIAPVDMAQSTIGPGMKVFSQYVKVVEADGSSMAVSSALAIINDVLGEILDGEEAELDAPTRFALTWFSEHGYSRGSSGDADNLARAKNTSLPGIEEAGVGEARAGEFRLYERSELAEGWSPMADPRLTVWEATQYLVIALDRSQTEAAALLQRLGGYGDRARQLAYLLFQKASGNGWASEAGAYNVLITAWPSLRSADVIADTPRLPLQNSGEGASVPDPARRLPW